MRHVFVVNPVAGKQTAQPKLLRRIESYFKTNGGRYEIRISEKPRAGQDLAREAAAAGDPVRVYACGGDGTLFDVVNGVVGCPNAEVGFIPCGSGNDFIKTFGPDLSAFWDLEAQIKGSSFPLDLIRCGDRYAVNQGSVGIDAEIAALKDRFNGLPFVDGKAAYVLAALYRLTRRMSQPLTLRVDDGEAFTGEYLFALAANGQYYGGGFRSAPDADPYDGLLDIVLVKKVSRPRFALLLGKYRRGEHGSLDEVTLLKGKTLEISAPKEAVLNLDGEIFYEQTVRFEAAEKGIRFIRPGFCAVSDEDPLQSPEPKAPRPAPVCDTTNGPS